jgi:hypothetical protein
MSLHGTVLEELIVPWDSQEIPRILGNPKFHYLRTRSCHLSLCKPGGSRPHAETHFPKIYIILPSAPKSPLHGFKPKFCRNRPKDIFRVNIKKNLIRNKTLLSSTESGEFCNVKHRVQNYAKKKVTYFQMTQTVCVVLSVETHVHRTVTKNIILR